MALAQGNICWYEIPTPDFEKSKAFYSKLFGWKFQQEKTFSNDYWFISPPANGIGGGLYRGEPIGRPTIIPYFVVSDMGEAIQQASHLGGKVLKPKTLITQETGYFAHIQDNVGNLIAFWSQE